MQLSYVSVNFWSSEFLCILWMMDEDWIVKRFHRIRHVVCISAALKKFVRKLNSKKLGKLIAILSKKYRFCRYFLTSPPKLRCPCLTYNCVKEWRPHLSPPKSVVVASEVVKTLYFRNINHGTFVARNSKRIPPS